MLGRTGLLARNITQSLVRHSSHGGIPGENLPFGLTNRYKLTAYFVLFFGSGLAAPFLVVRHQLLKK
ncbi:cytochrome c oxidase subunit 7C, mitochondrial-like [Anastrepha ludens]|uniref:cytochrome c oxidase subunit 7C, mitochondrial-like n=1 Tax=Anastrepha ludens TaxID=28586 RepID=UPI0023AE761B|nr:cytochrome c oxidase subunit 7C, mitochondrial-like [Anastrepha ludens]